MEFELKQRGRASIDFAVDLAGVAFRLGMLTEQEIQETISEFEEDLDERLVQVDTELADSLAFRGYRQLGEWTSVNHGLITIDAFEEIREELEPALLALEEGPTTIETNPDCEIPDYWKGVWIHRTTGGWDGHEHMGFIHGELIHKRYVSRNYPGQIFAQRGQVLEELPRDDYNDIFEMGTSSGHYTVKLAERFPDARITGCDLSVTMLRNAQRTANEEGLSWRLIQAPAEATGLPDASFDLVTSFIVLHEVPASAARDMFQDAFRLLRPGGSLLMCDVRPHREWDQLGQWRVEYLAINGGEPYWREAASLDLAELAHSIGFEDARSYGLGERQHPWVTVATKPMDAAT